MKKILVCGGRDYPDEGYVFKILDHIVPFDAMIIHGGAKGADALADSWAKCRIVKIKVYKADWEKYGKKAGILRNIEMLKENPDLVIAFPGGKGTKHMVSIAKADGHIVLELPL